MSTYFLIAISDQEKSAKSSKKVMTFLLLLQAHNTE